MLSSNIIELKNVWKKYSTKDVFHRSLREDLLNFINTKDGNRGKSLRKDEFWALKDINISIQQGECVGLYGPNGSGKTTILKLIASVTYPTNGEVKVKGKIAPLIAAGAGFHPDLTGRENIYMNGTIVGMTIKEIKEKINNIIEFSGIDKKFIDMPVKKYSSGMFVRLGFSIAIHSSADILLIDEILAVGDETFQRKCIDKLKELKKINKTIIIVSQNKKRMEEVVDRIVFINNGEIVDDRYLKSIATS
ncbi:MAG: ABC transporter ATP-binding protein [Deltaproteobacteria bacterium]|nr:MAG: ABC transporter ATP-binding protein [Deltaproteobacteria bacterium]